MSGTVSMIGAAARELFCRSRRFAVNNFLLEDKMLPKCPDMHYGCFWATRSTANSAGQLAV